MHRQMNIDDTLAAIAKVVGLAPAARPADLASAERRLGCQLPAQLRAFYLRANGTLDATPVENGWTRLWSAAEWRNVSTLSLGSVYSSVSDAIVVADYSLESWWYALGLDEAVYIVDGLRPARPVAGSFLEFVALLLNDRKEIYPIVDGRLTIG